MTFPLKQYDHGYYQLNKRGAIFIPWYSKVEKNTMVSNVTAKVHVQKSRRS